MSLSDTAFMNISFLHEIRAYELNAAVPFLPQKGRLLEIGAGTGMQARMLAECGYEVVAIDIPTSNFKQKRVWFAVNRTSRWLLMGLTPFIHASFFFILALLALTWLLRSIRFVSYLKTVTYVAAGIAVGLGLGVLAELLGARQGSQYLFKRTDVSGLGFSLWIMILGIMLSAGKTWLREHAFESGVVTFYLVTYWLIEVTARVFESSLMVVLLAGLTLRGWRRQAFQGIVLGAGALAWVLRIGKPALGFADG